MQRHAEIGFLMLSGSGIDVLDAAAEIALTHHERCDGTGYPHRLKAAEIPLPGRIVAVADVFDALTSDRVYKAAMDFDVAVDVIEQGSGTQFDPTVVAAFLRRIDCVREIHTSYGSPAAAEAPALAA